MCTLTLKKTATAAFFKHLYEYIFDSFNQNTAVISSHCCISFSSCLFNVPDQFYHLIFPPCLSLVLFRGPGCTNTKAHRPLWRIWLDICYDWPDWAISYCRLCWERGGIQTCNNTSAIEFQSPTMCMCVFVCTAVNSQACDATAQEHTWEVCVSLSWKTKSSKCPQISAQSTKSIQFLDFAGCCNFRMKWNQWRFWIADCGKTCMHRC